VIVPPFTIAPPMLALLIEMPVLVPGLVPALSTPVMYDFRIAA